MKVCMTSREGLYRILGAAFKELGTRPNVAELGVHSGQNARALFDALAPSRLLLVDRWAASDIKDYTPFPTVPTYIRPLESENFTRYFGGDVRDQRTHDALLAKCRSRFSDGESVEILRAATDEAFEVLKGSGERFDVVYIDANHQYEWVLRDLMLYSELVGPDGVIALNDCCSSIVGMEQNLGVLEAVGQFIKRSDFVPIALTSTHWSDLILVRRHSRLVSDLHDEIVAAGIAFVEVPASMLAGAFVLATPNGAMVSFESPPPSRRIRRMLDAGVRSVVVMGAAPDNRDAIAEFMRSGIKVVAVSERNAAIHGQHLFGAPVVGLPDALARNPDAVWIPSIRHCDSMLSDLRAAGTTERGGLRAFDSGGRPLPL